MPEMSKAFTPEFMGEKNPNQKILKLAKKITDVVAHKIKITSDDPEYWGLRCICTDEMADIGLAMKLRTPYTFEEMKALMKGWDPAHLEEVLEEMSRVGLLEYDYGDHYDNNGPIPGAPRVKRYILPMFVPGSAEFTNMVKSQMDAHPELAQFFERMTFIPLAGITEMVPPGGAGIGMHVIPVEKAISAESSSADIEHISHWLKKYEGHLSVGMCSCRYGRANLGEGCGDSAEDWCIGVGDMADYCAETGKGRMITYDEAIKILENAEANGFVHEITNIDGEDKIFAICNCNVNICNALRTSQLFNTPNLSRSAYTAKVDPENCVACGKCVEKCPAGAVKLGQKLCTTHGPIEYPRHELPDATKWGEDHWDENYRDTARINCWPTGTAPCKTACPAHIAVQGYLKKASQGKYQEALALIKKDNPFPAICGRVCNRKCEEACTRGTIDEAVSIDAVKKFIAEKDLRAETRYVPPVVIRSNLGPWKEKIAIIGAGPAGLSAAYYLATEGYTPTVFEKSAEPGGMMRYGIPTYKLEKDVIKAEIDVLRELGVEFKCGVEVGKDITIEELRKQGYKAFYIAIGCQGGRLAGVPGEDAAGIEIAVNFLHNALDSQEKYLEGKNVVVIGGGNVACDCAGTAHRLGAASVSCYCLEDKDHILASPDEVAEIKDEGASWNPSWGPKEILKDENGAVKAIVLKKCLRTIDPDTGKFDPKYDETETVTVACDHVVYAIGQAVVWGDLLKGTKVEFHRGNYPVADPLTYQTAEPDIFVGGDVFTGPKFVIDAIEQGHQAAESLHRFVQPGSSLTIGRNRRQFVELNKNEIVVEQYDNAKRQDAGMDESVDWKNSFRDAHKVLTEEQVKIETARCLGCGASVVDPNKCIGCGVCTTKCEFDAIHLHRDHPEMSKMMKSEDKFKAILPYAAKRAVKILTHKK